MAPGYPGCAKQPRSANIAPRRNQFHTKAHTNICAVENFTQKNKQIRGPLAPGRILDSGSQRFLEGSWVFGPWDLGAFGVWGPCDSRSPHMDPRWTQMAPDEHQQSPSKSSRALSSAPAGPEMASDSPKLLPNDSDGPLMSPGVPRCVQAGLHM